MHLKLTGWNLVALGLPIAGLAAGLALDPSLWLATGPRGVRPAVPLIMLAIAGLVGWVASQSDAVRSAWSTSGWMAGRHVESNPGQATVAIQLVRWGAVAVVWLAAVRALR